MASRSPDDNPSDFYMLHKEDSVTDKISLLENYEIRIQQVVNDTADVIFEVVRCIPGLL